MAIRASIKACLIGVALILPSCAMLGQQNKQPVTSTLRIYVERNIRKPKPVFTVVFRGDFRPESIIDFRRALSEKTTEFSLPPGTYLVLAFHDVNRDDRYQNWEPVTYYGDPTVIEFSKQPRSLAIDLDFSVGRRAKIPFTIDFSDRTLSPEVMISRPEGEYK